MEKLVLLSDFWNIMPIFYKVGVILLFFFPVMGAILDRKSSEWAKLGDEYKAYECKVFAKWSFLQVVIVIMGMLLYPLFYSILHNPHAIFGWCSLIVLITLLVFGIVLEISDFKKNKNFIREHRAWEDALDEIRSQLKNRLSAVFGDDLSVEEFEFCVPQNNERYPDDGLISFVEGPSILAKVRETLKNVPPASKVVLVDERIYILPKDNGDTRIRNMEKELFKDMLVDLSKIRYSIVFKKGEDYFVVSRGCLIPIIIPR